jgi:hypothetical protein
MGNILLIARYSNKQWSFSCSVESVKDGQEKNSSRPWILLELNRSVDRNKKKIRSQL